MISDVNSALAKTVLLYLSSKGESHINTMKSDLDVKLIELFSVVKQLVNKNLITKTGNQTYTVNDPVV